MNIHPKLEKGHTSEKGQTEENRRIEDRSQAGDCLHMAAERLHSSSNNASALFRSAG